MSRAETIGTTHHVKLKEQFVRPILEGRMRYQVRNADRGYQNGDRIKFNVVTLDGRAWGVQEKSYCDFGEVRRIEDRCYRIDYVMPVGENMVVFSISEIPDPDSKDDDEKPAKQERKMPRPKESKKPSMLEELEMSHQAAPDLVRA